RIEPASQRDREIGQFGKRERRSAVCNLAHLTHHVVARSPAKEEYLRVLARLGSALAPPRGKRMVRLNHDVRVNASEAERADARPARSLPRPRQRLRGDAQWTARQLV